MMKTYEMNNIEVIRIYNGNSKHEYFEIICDDDQNYYTTRTVREDYDYYENEWL